MKSFSLNLKKPSKPPPTGSSAGAPVGSAASVSALFQASLDAEEATAQAAEKRGVLQSVRLASGPDRRHKIQQEKALAEDSTVFTYDEIFESVSSAATKDKAKQSPRIFLGYKTGLEEQRETEQGQAEPLSSEHADPGCGDDAEALPHDDADAGGSTAARPRPSGDKSFETYGGTLNCGLNLAGQRGRLASLSGREKREKSTGGDAEGGVKQSLPASRFISKLVLSARRRALEREIVEERQLQKEREGDKNDEVFVTSAYKQRLEERRLLALELEEQERRDRENAPDKQSDLSSFHAHLLRAGHASRSGGGVERTPNTGRPSSGGGRESEEGERAKATGEQGTQVKKERMKVERTEESSEDRGEQKGGSPRDAGAGVDCAGETKPEREAEDSGKKGARLTQGEGTRGEEASGEGRRGGGLAEAERGERKEGEDGGARGEDTEEDAKQKRARLEDLLQQRKREKQRELEKAAAPLGEEKLAEAKRRYLERKRKAAGGG
ncbi:conserved hypothetical protein [Neospora caninum Liverpool]|uniref:Nuclear speckle splicing regulatory protein 1 N-terminal domain-containing protein n=1 Tax=Neospora caninum (strain Liverpool) TaxID=572307 RepID=F0VP26_NEOCL|nr:conserved hypothetical protein [Neospora caninum Liverpool]CBZ55472.1 conserved hypothetical protein [Neospora caninum Liverpool]CEL70209.1 TPA: hypothetical protein BN1204_058950 [Neospora caninum Liverpool]|eukprot:XP_003885500.1 conserved hypothetical protein [Neospora caninum Liverpool]